MTRYWLSECISKTLLPRRHSPGFISEQWEEVETCRPSLFTVHGIKCLVFPSTGDHGHCTDHLRHGHPGARAAWDDGGGGWSPPPAAAGCSQASHYGHRGHLQRFGWDEEPDSPGRSPGGIAEVEAGWGVILVAVTHLKTMTVHNRELTNVLETFLR